MVEDEYLGGSGTRGSGKVAFQPCFHPEEKTGIYWR